MVSNSRFDAVNDDTPDKPTEIYSVLTMVCINSAIDPKTKKLMCPNYCGKDLNNPLKIVTEVRNKVN